MIKHNVGILDRTLRVILGAFLLLLAVTSPAYFPGVALGIVLLIGLILVITGFLGTCMIYSLFGINTCEECKVDETEAPKRATMAASTSKARTTKTMKRASRTAKAKATSKRKTTKTAKTTKKTTKAAKATKKPAKKKAATKTTKRKTTTRKRRK